VPQPAGGRPAQIVPHVVHGSVPVDLRSFGVRTPPCTREAPSYGIMGMFHVLPPALAWLWRLVAPRVLLPRTVRHARRLICRLAALRHQAGEIKFSISSLT
jgi:hypothetical protein